MPSDVYFPDCCRFFFVLGCLSFYSLLVLILFHVDLHWEEKTTLLLLQDVMILIDRSLTPAVVKRRVLVTEDDP